MSLPDRRAMIDVARDYLSVRRQCELLALARSGVHRPQSATAARDLALMRRLDDLHLKLPFYGSRRMLCGRWTSPISRWRMAFSIWRR